jgi:hypothetical protein
VITNRVFEKVYLMSQKTEDGSLKLKAESSKLKAKSLKLEDGC